ncbi:MAG: N-acetyltransferase [Candidatus Diapherotrites archaeon]|nr:N-acetyltransferase [Candidatus Diapherotrites archaeon]
MIRKAKISDVKQIKALLSSYAAKGLLLDRSALSIYEQLRDFVVFEENSEIKACCALHICWEGLGEIRSLAVKEEHWRKGIGKGIVEECLAEAKRLELQKVFTLTYVPDFFKKIGFQEIPKDVLPHKIWADCINCVKFPDCDETAMQIEI